MRFVMGVATSALLTIVVLTLVVQFQFGRKLMRGENPLSRIRAA